MANQTAQEFIHEQICDKMREVIAKVGKHVPKNAGDQLRAIALVSHAKAVLKQYGGR